MALIRGPAVNTLVHGVTESVQSATAPTAQALASEGEPTASGEAVKARIHVRVAGVWGQSATVLTVVERGLVEKATVSDRPEEANTSVRGVTVRDSFCAEARRRVHSSLISATRSRILTRKVPDRPPISREKVLHH